MTQQRDCSFRGCVQALLACLFFSASCPLWAQVVRPAVVRPAAGLPTLTSARAVHQLTPPEAAKARPVDLHAVVTYYDPYIDPRRPILFITDESGSVFVVPASRPAEDLKPGQQVEVTGITASGDFAPIVDHALARVTGESHLPLTARRVNIGDLLNGPADGQWVEIEGLVHAVREKGRNVFLDLVLRDGTISAAAVKQSGEDYRGLLDAEITLRGNQAPLFNHQGQMTGAQLLFPGMAALHVEQAGPTDPFQLPVNRVSDILRYVPEATVQHRVHIRGTVTLLWPGRLLCLQDGGTGICAQTDQMAIPDGLAPGAIADVIGFPRIGAFAPTLVHATYRAAVSTGHPGTPPAVTASEALHGNRDAQLVTIDGRLIGVDRAAADPTIVLSSGNFVFSAVLSSQASGSAAKLPELEEGSQLRITGVCQQQTDGAPTTDFPVARSFRILLRTPGDISVVERPSWWNASHTLKVLALALVLALAALFRLVMQGQRIRQQTATIRESEERFRELASLDGLTLLPNRSAILATLSASLDAAVEQGTEVCVAILDLDHFKQINDTYGHLAGDRVLQVAATRLAAAVRSTDAIGRYGGEEFLVVFRNADHTVGVESCERIRQAIGGSPVASASHVLPLSCSIGMACARAGVSSPMALIAEADDALYRAKARGRNRVECSAPVLERVPVHQ